MWWLQNDFHSIFQIQYSFELIPECAKEYRSHDVESYLSHCNPGMRLYSTSLFSVSKLT